MPEELAIALAVLIAIGWILYKVVQTLAKVAETAHSGMNYTIRNQRNRLYQKRRARIAPHVHVVLPQELKIAEIRLKEAEAHFVGQQKASIWRPERPVWQRTEFRPFVLSGQRPSARALDISEIKLILSPNSRPWHEEESELLKSSCSYPHGLSLVNRKTLQQCEVPSMALTPAVFAIAAAAVRENDVAKFFGRERSEVMAYNSRREELLCRQDSLVTQIALWNREEQIHSDRYQRECDRLVNDATSSLKQHVVQFESRCCQQKAEFSAALQGFRMRSRNSVLRRVEFILDSIHLPTCVPRFWKLDYDEQERILIVEIALPDVVHNPPMKTVQ